MFERNRIDRIPDAEKTVHHVALTLRDGSEISGRVLISQNRGLMDELNASHTFIEVDTYPGERVIVAKGMIRQARTIDMPKSEQLAKRMRQLETSDPLTLLQLKPGADSNDIRASYHRLAKLYHPDRYLSLDLPKEISDYVAAVSVRLNAAYAALSERAEA